MIHVLKPSIFNFFLLLSLFFSILCFPFYLPLFPSSPPPTFHPHLRRNSTSSLSLFPLRFHSLLLTLSSSSATLHSPLHFPFSILSLRHTHHPFVLVLSLYSSLSSPHLPTPPPPPLHSSLPTLLPSSPFSLLPSFGTPFSSPP